MTNMSEQFGASLVRVIKKVRRRSPDGGTQVVKQAFHVKKANPTDEYSAADGKRDVPPMPRAGKKIATATGPMLQPAQATSQEPVQAEPEPAPVTRMSVRYYDIPWLKKKTQAAVTDEDPIPADMRRRYEKGNRALQVIDPGPMNIAASATMPTDRILWGVDEPDLLNDLRSGTVQRMRVVKPKSGLTLVRMEAHRGGSYSAYLWLESLRDPVLTSIWGDLVDLSEAGSLSRRASSAYEVSKACGFDDVIPPTIGRFDEEGDLTSVLPDDLIDWVSSETGDDPESVRNRLGGHATVQLVRDKLWTIDGEKWFKSIFEANQTDALNNIWDVMPPDRRISFLRLAMFDFTVWNLDRCLGDIAFCDNPKHPVIAYGNELSMPCPSKLGKRYIESGIGSYSDAVTNAVTGRAILLNDVMAMLAIRGGDDELADCEKIGQNIATRMKGSRGTELARALIDRKLSYLQVAGALSRIWMLATHSKDIARDPYFAVRYYAQAIQGTVPDEMKGIAEFVDQVMQHTVVGDFDFVKLIKSEAKDEKRS
ncbi:MAG: hypothetical protein ACYTFU_08845 [Planctomycetota bacterium]